ncbi:hypothetical protein [Oceanicella sp. SM1341]|uniref:hypothetical protein n=1 Tax=Oceanicella sp. SM1341 TaxID=1548889 RepID=UPI000E483C51|nr:hypothetical protein [Oceanicella sp. SM1341]
MTEDESSRTGPRGGPARGKPAAAGSREERLAAALRANLQRRKAQGRARAASDDSNDTDEET